MAEPAPRHPADPVSTGAPPAATATDSAPPLVPPPGAHPPGFATIHDKPRKLWTVGTLVYTTGGLMIVFFWLLFGDFALAMRDRSVDPVAKLMLKGFGATNFQIALLATQIPVVIGMILSPIISYKSDRLRSRWGRRIPFLLIPTPIAAFAMVGMAFCPHIATALQEMTSMSRTTALLTVFAVFWTCYEIAIIVANAVMGGLINDVVPRPVLGRFYALFRAISLIDGMIFNWFILGHAEAHFTIIFVWIASVFGVGFSLMCMMVREGDYPAPSVPVPTPRPPGLLAGIVARGQAFMTAVAIYFRECFGNPHYWWVFSAFTLAGLAANPINAWSIVYAKQQQLGMGAWDSAVGIGFGEWRLGYGGIMTLTYICSLSLAYPLGSLVDRFHALRVSVAAMLLYAASCLASYFVIDDPTSFGWALLAHGVLSGTYFTAAASLGQVLLPKLRFSQFWSAGVLVTNLVTLLYNPMLGKVLDWTNSNYRITFLLSGLFATAALLLLYQVYLRFMTLGGPRGYVAPLREGAEA